MLRYQPQRTSIEVQDVRRYHANKYKQNVFFLLNHEFMKLFFFFHWPSTPTQIRGSITFVIEFWHLAKPSLDGQVGIEDCLHIEFELGFCSVLGFRWWWDKPP